MSRALTARERLIVALDVDSRAEALALVAGLSPHMGLFKVGMQLFYSQGPGIVEAIHAAGGRVFLDLKLHDIPNTVARAARVLTRLGAAMLTLHAAGGREMLAGAALAAREEAARLGIAPPLVLGVTVLTSLAGAALAATGVGRPLEEQVLALACLSRAAGLDGVVASALEAPAIKAACGREFLVATPGIRPAGAAGDDQNRIVTPRAALAGGADYLVVGRPITTAPNPAAAAAGILAEMEASHDAQS